MKITSIENGHLMQKCIRLVCRINHWNDEIIILLFGCTLCLEITISMGIVSVICRAQCYEHYKLFPLPLSQTSLMP